MRFCSGCPGRTPAPTFRRATHRHCAPGGTSYSIVLASRTCAPMDTLTRKQRSRQMALIRSKNTKPEILVRRIVRASGYNFRQHLTNLPGKPDVVFPGLKKIIFVHGCFWHGHTCRLGRMPKSRVGYWKKKIRGNRDRDMLTLRRLRSMRWRCLVLWECQLRDIQAVSQRIGRFLRHSSRF